MWPRLIVRMISTPLKVALADRRDWKLCRYPRSRFIAVVYLADNTGVGLRLVGTDRDRAVQPDTLNRFVEKGSGGFRISPCGQAEVDHLSVRIHSAPEVRHLPPTRM